MNQLVQGCVDGIPAGFADPLSANRLVYLIIRNGRVAGNFH